MQDMEWAAPSGTGWARQLAGGGPDPTPFPAELSGHLERLGVFGTGRTLLVVGGASGAAAREAARRGALVAALESDAERLGRALEEDRGAGVSVDRVLGAIEEPGLDAGAFGAILAGPGWARFGLEGALEEVRRLLEPGGILAAWAVRWLPADDVVACTSEELALKYDPGWKGAGWDGSVAERPSWAPGGVEVVAREVFDARVRLAPESWRRFFLLAASFGRDLPREELERFDGEHRALLGVVGGGAELAILHRCQLHLLRV